MVAQSAKVQHFTICNITDAPLVLRLAPSSDSVELFNHLDEQAALSRSDVQSPPSLEDAEKRDFEKGES